MIISCAKCNKNFEVENNLIPDNGRLVECGSCGNKWHFIPIKKPESRKNFTPKNLKTTNESNEKYKENKISKKDIKDEIKIAVTPAKTIFDLENINPQNLENIKPQKKIKNNRNIFQFLVVFIISFLAFIIIIDTFTNPLISYFPKIDFYLNSFYETIRDILLFFSDLF